MSVSQVRRTNLLTNPLIISRLIEAGKTLYIPIGGENIIIIQTLDGPVPCHTTNVSQDQSNSPILRTPPVPMMTAACDALTKTVWLIPINAMEGKKICRLGKRYEEYIIPEPISKCYQEQKNARHYRLEELKKRAEQVAKGE